MEALSPEVLEDLRHGRATPERKIAVCSGAAHLAPADHVEILAVLCKDADERVAQRAEEALGSQPVESFLEAIRRPNAVPALFAYASVNFADKPTICEALVQNKTCGAEYLVAIAAHLGTLGVQALMDNLDRVAESPALIAALQSNTSLTAEHKNLLQELLGSSIDEGGTGGCCPGRRARSREAADFIAAAGHHVGVPAGAVRGEGRVGSPADLDPRFQ